MNSIAEQVLSENLLEDEKKWLLKSLYDLCVDTNIRQDASTNLYWSNAHPTRSLTTAINFDGIARLYCKVKQDQGYTCKSCDALYVGYMGNTDVPEIYWIEFKNGEIKNNDVREIIQKIYEGNIVFLDIERLNSGTLDLTNPKNPKLIEGTRNFDFERRLRDLKIPVGKMSFLQEHAHFILVYNETKKETLLQDDLKSICCEIKQGKYSDLVESVYNLLQNQECARTFLENVNQDEGLEPEKLLLKLIGHKGTVPKEWFDEFVAYFRLLEKLATNSFVNECAVWETMSGSDYDDLCDWLGNEKNNYRSQMHINSFKRVIARIKELKTMDEISRRDKFLKVFVVGFDESTAAIKAVLKYLRRIDRLRQLETDGLASLVQKLRENPVLIPLGFEGAPEEYVRENIERDTFEELIAEADLQNAYTPLFFLEVTARAARLPVALFNFGLYNGFLYKDSCTYNRKEFYDYFVNEICRNCGDEKWQNFA